jgi:hypothetical protein
MDAHNTPSPGKAIQQGGNDLNKNKLLFCLNLTAVFATLIFCLCLKTLIPEQFESYIDGLLLIIVAALSAGPFVINHFLFRKISLPKQKITYIGLFLLFLLVAIDLFCLIVMYRDQFESSRGFGLIWCIEIYSFIFMPAWIAFLVMFMIIKKRVLRKMNN